MRIHTILSVLALSLFATGCTKHTKAGETPAKGAPISVEMTEKLAKADAFDGKTDKIVSKCIGCSLKMDGSDKHSVMVGDYTLHLCDNCAAGKADPAKLVAEATIPEKK